VDQSTSSYYFVFDCIVDDLLQLVSVVIDLQDLDESVLSLKRRDLPNSWYGRFIGSRLLESRSRAGSSHPAHHWSEVCQRFRNDHRLHWSAPFSPLSLCHRYHSFVLVFFFPTLLAYSSKLALLQKDSLVCVNSFLFPLLDIGFECLID
jgi:hypothetical protein